MFQLNRRCGRGPCGWPNEGTESVVKIRLLKAINASGVFRFNLAGEYPGHGFEAGQADGDSNSSAGS